MCCFSLTTRQPRGAPTHSDQKVARLFAAIHVVYGQKKAAALGTNATWVVTLLPPENTASLRSLELFTPFKCVPIFVPTPCIDVTRLRSISILDGEQDRSRRLTKAKNKTENFHLERHSL